jgi:site-specific recombinase XerC
VRHYSHHLRRFEAYLGKIGVQGLQELSPALLSAFVAERSVAGLAKTSVRDGCGVLRVFLRYAHRKASSAVISAGPWSGRRCIACRTSRNLGLGGAYVHCDEPLLLTELLGDGGATILD